MGKMLSISIGFAELAECGPEQLGCFAVTQGEPASNLVCPQAGHAAMVLGWARVWEFDSVSLWKGYESAAHPVQVFSHPLTILKWLLGSISCLFFFFLIEDMGREQVGRGGRRQAGRRSGKPRV